MHPLIFSSRAARIAGLAALLCCASARADDVADINKLVRSGQLPAALAKVDVALAQHPKDAQLRFIKGMIFSEQGKANEAIAIFQKLTEDYPELPEPYNNLAVLYAGQGQYDKARVALERAIRTNPTYATAHENLGDVYAKLASQSYDKAMQILDTNQQPAPKSKLSMVRSLGVKGPALTPAGAAQATTAPQIAAAPAAAATHAPAPAAGPAAAHAAPPLSTPAPVIAAAQRPAATQLASAAPAPAPATAAASRAPATAQAAAASKPILQASAAPASSRTPAASVPTPMPTPAPAAAAGKQAVATAAAASVPAKPAAAASVPAKPAAAASAPAVQLAKAEPVKTDSGEHDNVAKAVDSWAKAWSAQDMRGYLSSYGSNFQTPRGQNRKAWEADRVARIEGKEHIKVTVEAPQITVNGNMATVKFRQIYVSDRLKANSRKTLVMEKQGSKWVIKQEQSGG